MAVLKNKRFFFGGTAVVLVSLAIWAVLFLPNPFDTVIAYHKTELAIVSPANPPDELVSEVTPDVEIEQIEIEDSTEELAVEIEPEIEATTKITAQNESDLPVPTVPFYSQFNDITPASWKKVGCGIASLAMLIEYYNPGSVTVDNLLQEGIAANAYLDSAGWTYAGLIGISEKYGLSGKTYDYGNQSMDKAYTELVAELEEGPVMASVHYTFQKSNPIPHLVIINGIEDGEVYYNDPAEKEGGGSISVAQFQSAWKKRYIEFRLL